MVMCFVSIFFLKYTIHKSSNEFYIRHPNISYHQDIKYPCYSPVNEKEFRQRKDMYYYIPASKLYKDNHHGVVNPIEYPIKSQTYANEGKYNNENIANVKSDRKIYNDKILERYVEKAIDLNYELANQKLLEEIPLNSDAQSESIKLLSNCLIEKYRLNAFTIYNNNKLLESIYEAAVMFSKFIRTNERTKMLSSKEIKFKSGNTIVRFDINEHHRCSYNSNMISYGFTTQYLPANKFKLVNIKNGNNPLVTSLKSPYLLDKYCLFETGNNIFGKTWIITDHFTNIFSYNCEYPPEMVSTFIRDLISSIVFLENNDYTLEYPLSMALVHTFKSDTETHQLKMVDTGNFIKIDPATQSQRNQSIFRFLSIFLIRLASMSSYNNNHERITEMLSGFVAFDKDVDKLLMDFCIILSGNTKIPPKSFGDLLLHPFIAGGALKPDDQFGERNTGTTVGNKIIFQTKFDNLGSSIGKSANIDDVLSQISKSNENFRNLAEITMDEIPNPSNHHVIKKSEAVYGNGTNIMPENPVIDAYYEN